MNQPSPSRQEKTQRQSASPLPAAPQTDSVAAAREVSAALAAQAVRQCGDASALSPQSARALCSHMGNAALCRWSGGDARAAGSLSPLPARDLPRCPRNDIHTRPPLCASPIALPCMATRPAHPHELRAALEDRP